MVLLEFSMSPMDQGESVSRYVSRSLDIISKSGVAYRLNPMALSATAINSYMNNLSAFFGWAVREEYVDKNVASDLTIMNPVKKKDRWNPLSLDQLQKIFSAPLYTGCKDGERNYAFPGPNRPRRGRFWVPLLSLWTGMRETECCQLLVSDITKKDGVDVILVRKGGGGAEIKKRVKTAAGERFVPIHPELEKIGFMNLVEGLRKKGEVKLFPELKADKYGYYGDHLGRWFRNFLTKSGAAANDTSFHSLRHNYRDALREADISGERVTALGGWAGSGGEGSGDLSRVYSARAVRSHWAQPARGL